MERVGRVSKNAAALVLAKIVTSSLVFLLAILINRDLGPEKAGVYNYAFALYTIFMVLPDFGIGNISIRDVSQKNYKINWYFTNIVSLRMLLAGVAFLLLMVTNLVAYIFQRSNALAGEQFWAVFAMAFTLLVEPPISNSLAENFIALERLTTVAMVYIVMGFMRVGLSTYVVSKRFEQAIVILILIYILTHVYAITHFYLTYRGILKKENYFRGQEQAEQVEPGGGITCPMDEIVQPISGTGDCEEKTEDPEKGEAEVPPVMKKGPLTFDRKLWAYILRSAWPLAVVGAGVTIYASIDVPILSWIRGEREVGLYAAGGMFAKAFVFFTLALNMAILPAVSMVAGKFPQRLGEVWEKLMKYVLVLVIPLTIMVPLLARPLLILQEHDFISAWPVSWLTMAAMNFTFMTAICFPFFIAIDKQRVITKIILAGLALKVVLEFITIPLLGYLGAAITVLVSECAIFTLLYLQLSRELKHQVNLVDFAILPVAVLGACYGVSYLLYRVLVGGKVFTHEVLGTLGYVIIIAVAVLALYVAIVFLTRMISRKGLNELNELLKVD